MSKLRPIVTVAVFVVCLGITLAATVHVAVRGIPHHRPRPAGKPPVEGSHVPEVVAPEVVERDVRKTMLDEEMAKLSRDEQVQLARDVESLAASGRIGSLLNGEATPEQQARLRRNAFALARLLLLDKAKQYDKLPGSQRAEFLNAEIERWRPFAGLFQLALKSGDVTKKERRQLGKFLADLIRRLATEGD